MILRFQSNDLSDSIAEMRNFQHKKRNLQPISLSSQWDWIFCLHSFSLPPSTRHVEWGGLWASRCIASRSERTTRRASGDQSFIRRYLANIEHLATFWEFRLGRILEWRTPIFQKWPRVLLKTNASFPLANTHVRKSKPFRCYTACLNGENSSSPAASWAAHCIASR